MSELRTHLAALASLKKRCRGILLYSEDRWANPNVFWLSGISARCWLWVPFAGKPRLFVSPTYAPQMRGARARVEYTKSLDDVLSELPDARIGVDALHAPAALLGKIRSHRRATDVSKHLEHARSTKTKFEIKQIKRACAQAASILGEIKLPYRGSEAMLRADIEWEILQSGLEPAFPTIVASGSHIASPHHVPTTRAAKTPLLIDLGVRYNGYCSDTTRTYGSKYEKAIGKVFDAVEPMLAPGTRASDIYATAVRVLGKDAKHFITALGHGLGIAIHEPPNISPKSNHILQPGNVLTIEPGIYVPNGIRKENVYVITKRGAENLTDF